MILCNPNHSRTKHKFWSNKLRFFLHGTQYTAQQSGKPFFIVILCTPCFPFQFAMLAHQLLLWVRKVELAVGTKRLFLLRHERHIATSLINQYMCQSNGENDDDERASQQSRCYIVFWCTENYYGVSAKKRKKEVVENTYILFTSCILAANSKKEQKYIHVNMSCVIYSSVISL